MARLAEGRCKVIGMKGAAVHRLADGGFIVAQWGLTRHCADFAALVGFARQMGVM